jgi:hypothetical protein
VAASYTALGQRSTRSVQLLTEAAPVSAKEGVLLNNMESVAVGIHAPVGQTFTGVGTLLGYAYLNGAWLRYPAGDLDLSDAAGLQDAALGPLVVRSKRDWFQFIANGVTLSGAGTQITIDLMVVGSKGEAP